MATPLPDMWVTLPERLGNLDKLFETMEEKGLDAVELRTRRNVYWASNFWQNSYSETEFQPANSVVLSRHEPDHPILIIPDGYFGQLEYQPTWIKDIRTYRFRSFTQSDIPIEDQGLDRFTFDAALETEWYKSAASHYHIEYADAVLSAFKDLGLRGGMRIGVDDLRGIRAVEAIGANAVDAFGLVMGVRYFKTPFELELIRKGATISKLGQEHMARNWQDGMSWRETLQLCVDEINRLGGVSTTVDGRGLGMPQAAAIENGYMPGLGFCGFTGGAPDFILKPGTNMMTDVHGSYNGYCMDGGKTWRVGESTPTGSVRKRMEAFADAFGAMNDACRPGMTFRDVHPIAREALRKHGFPEADRALVFLHGLGMSHSDYNVDDPNWRMQEGGVVSTHLYVPGEPADRLYLEDVVDVSADGWQGKSYFDWDYVDWA